MSLAERIRRVSSEVAAHYDDYYWWRSRYVHRVAAPVQQAVYGDDGCFLPEADWDSLIVLDACRADLFESVVDRDRFDDYRRVRSLGSSTPEWTKRNFAGERLGDTVYVTANPQISKYAGDAFHELVQVWETDFDEERKTVLPDRVAAATRDALDRHPDKRLVAHFMQPHTPYLGRDELFPEGHGVTDRLLDESPEELKTMLDAVGHDAVWAAYRDNFERAMETVSPLLDDLDGRTVVTADHGELFGERGPPLYLRQYGHKTGIRQPDLVRVPWAIDDGPRRRIRDEGVSATESDRAEIERQLKHLGYK